MPIAEYRLQAGKRGEDLACAELRRLGYAILARRYRSRFGEIDLIGEHDNAVVFIEVKARKSGRRGTAAESITWRKRRKIAAMALDYLSYTHKLERRCRFDVVAIDGYGTARMTLRVIRDAFQVER